MQGGFIWDWVDQGLIHRKKLKDGREVEFWGYGGDWESPWPDDAQFNINGLIWPDRTPHPSMWECKAVMVRSPFPGIAQQPYPTWSMNPSTMRPQKPMLAEWTSKIFSPL